MPAALALLIALLVGLLALRVGRALGLLGAALEIHIPFLLRICVLLAGGLIRSTGATMGGLVVFHFCGLII